jgi:SAM-dependent methyltransferase
VNRHHRASELLHSVVEIVRTRPAGPEPPAWVARRAWVTFLGGMTGDAVLSAERDGLAVHVDRAPGAPSDLVDLAHAIRRVTDLPGAPDPTSRPPDGRRASVRKRAQVTAFARLVARLPRTSLRIFDVGSGHGHLTRHLARVLGVPVEGWERDAARVAVATSLSEGERVRFVTQDLRRALPVLSELDLVVGLHCCGELGDIAARAARPAPPWRSSGAVCRRTRATGSRWSCLRG